MALSQFLYKSKLDLIAGISVLDSSNNGVSGLTANTLTASIYSLTTVKWWNSGGTAFDSATAVNKNLVEVSATDFPGLYIYTLTGGYEASSGGIYYLNFIASGGSETFDFSTQESIFANDINYELSTGLHDLYTLAVAAANASTKSTQTKTIVQTILDRIKG